MYHTPRIAQGSISQSARPLLPDLHRKAINMQHWHPVQFGPSHVCLGQSARVSRCRHWLGGWCLNWCHGASTFLHPFAPPALPGFLATMDALTSGRTVRRVFVRDTPRPCTHPDLLVSCTEPSHRSASNHLLSPLDLGLVLIQGLPRGLPTASRPRDLSVVWASPLGCRLTTTTGRIEFVILRTGSSPPVALHLLSRGRSYFRLRSSDPTSARTSTCRFDTLTSAHPIRLARMVKKVPRLSASHTTI